jgi:hypothetical protein
VRPLVGICLLLSGMAGGAAAQGDSVREVGAAWREAPEYLPVLAPGGIRQKAYSVYVSPLDLETTLRQLDSDAALVRAPGAWQARPALPWDAFGQAGAYDRSAMARVYGARQPRVARGARMEASRVVESWTLIEPYPDTTLRRLETGTILIVLRLP